MLRRVPLVLLAAIGLQGCMPMPMTAPTAAPGGGAPGTSPEVCANIRARIEGTVSPDARAYAESQAAAIGC